MASLRDERRAAGLGGLSAVGPECGTGHKRREVRSEKQYYVRHFLRLSEAAHRYHFLEPVSESRLLQRRRQQRRIDSTRTNAIGAYSIARIFDLADESQIDHARLGRVVRRDSI